MPLDDTGPERVRFLSVEDGLEDDGGRKLESDGASNEREEYEEPSTFWRVLKVPRTQRERQMRQYGLLALNVSILLISVALNLGTWRTSLRAASLVCVHDSDMKDARHVIEYEERVYTGALMYDPETKGAVRSQDAEVEYFGPPSKELDAAWNNLLRGEFPVLTDEEALPYKPELVRIPTDQAYHFEPDMYHTLHCMNAIRSEVSKSLYNVSAGHHHHGLILPKGWDVPHMEHCMDRVMQSIMCFGDLTPSPLYYWPGSNIAFGRAGPHTCRKWGPIRDWMDERGTRGSVLKP